MEISGYQWNNAELTCSHNYLLPCVLSLMEKLSPSSKKVFELGCGNGSVANFFSKVAWDVTGVDPSQEGIVWANEHYPHLNLKLGSAYDNLADLYGQYPVVTSLEVIEHVYSPRQYAATLFSLLEPGGAAIVSTPYHGYWKNLALSLLGKMDEHFTALWDHGHIKFWSIRTLSQLLTEAGFVNLRFYKVGRIPFLAKSMIVVARKP